ncbi:MAG: CAP domain-containing protein [Planctomycetota bacterium]|nr:CAP domain-containing protein [Planctomycetota bacterium]
MLKHSKVGLLVCGLAGVLLACTCASAAQNDAEQARQRAVTALKSYDGMFRFLGEKAKAERLVQEYEALGKLSEAARGFLFDNSKYAIPAKAFSGWNPYKDVQPGHEDMEALVGPSVDKFNELTNLLTAAMGTRAETVGRSGAKNKAAHIRFYTLQSALGTFDQWLPQLKQRYEAYQKAREEMGKLGAEDTDETKLAALGKALGELASGRYAEAKAAGAGLSGLEAEFFRTVCDYEVLRWNRANPCGHDANAAKGVETMNLYRMSLNIRPMAHHPKLREMAQDFANEQATKKFFGHVHPSDETRKTYNDRAKRVGYAGVASENCASFGSDTAYSVWMWRTDAGHHRGMITPAFTEVGLGVVSTAVLNVGKGKESEVLKLIY